MYDVASHGPRPGPKDPQGQKAHIYKKLIGPKAHMGLES